MVRRGNSAAKARRKSLSSVACVPRDHLRRTGGDVSPRRLDAANATADLDGHLAGRVDDGLDKPPVHRFPREGPVEVYDVQAACAELAPVLGHRRRVVGIDRGGRHDALLQLHAATVLEVDGRDQEHYSVPFVEGVSSVRGSRASAMRSARPKALKMVSA